MSYLKKAATFGVVLGLTIAAGAANADVKIGFMATLSGEAAALGVDQLDAFKLALDENHGELGGQKVTLVTADDQLKPDVAIQQINKLIFNDKVDLITGVTFSNVMMAVAKPLADANMTFVGSNAGPAPLAGKQCNAGFFFTSWQNAQQAEVVGQYAKDHGYKNIFSIVPDYQSGREQVAGFKQYYGGPVTEDYTRLGQTDFSSELLKIAAAKPDALFVFEPGGMGVNFIKQYAQFGLKIPLLTVSTTDGTTLPAEGKAAVGALAGTFWGPDFKNAVSEKFVKDFEAKYGRVPSQYAAQSYDAALLIASALKKTNGNVADKAAFRKALRAADFDSLRGHFTFNVNGFPIQNFYMFKVVEGANGKPALKTIAEPLKNNKDSYYKECPL